MGDPGYIPVLPAGTTVTGDVEAVGDLRIEGSVRGRAVAHGRLAIAPGGSIEGTAEAREIDLYGRVAGIVRAVMEVRVHPGGVVAGDVEAPKVRFLQAGSAEAPAVAAVSPPPPAPGPEPPAAHAPPEPGPKAAAPAGEARSAEQPPGAGAFDLPVRSIPIYAPRSARPDPLPPLTTARSDDMTPPPLPTVTGAEPRMVVRRR